MRYAHDFQTILGRNLVGELKNFVHRPFLLVTMEDIWPKFERELEGAQYHRYFVRSVDDKVLLEDAAKLPRVEAVVGLGGGMVVDTAKFFSRKKRLPLFRCELQSCKTSLLLNRIPTSHRELGPEVVAADPEDYQRASPPS